MTASIAPSASLLARVDSALRRVPPVLADAQARQSLRAVARRLPAGLAQGPIGFEFRLAGRPIVDLSAAVVPTGPTIGDVVTALENESWADERRARALASALRGWQDGMGSLSHVARFLLLEVDAPALPQDQAEVPSAFLAPRRVGSVEMPGAARNVVHRSPEEATRATAELAGVWPDPAVALALAAVVETLPAPGEVFSVGVMLSRRAGSSLRLAVSGLDPDGMHAVLSAAGLPSQANVIAERARETVAVSRNIAFEVGPGAEGRVGLELSPGHDWRSARLDGWRELLDELARLGVATGDRVALVPALVDAEGDPLWGLAHVKVVAGGEGLLPVSKLYAGTLDREVLASLIAAGGGR